MYRFWHVYGPGAEYAYLTASAQCANEADVRAWMKDHHPQFEIKTIEEDKGN